MLVEPDNVPSRREEKKAQTRRALIEVSQQLFSEQGYSNTTLEQISAQVGIRQQTLLRYFDSKAALALAPLASVVADLRTKVEDPERESDTVSLWREHVETRSWYVRASSADATRRFYAWADQDPVLVAMIARLNVETQEILAAGIARDHGTDSDDLHPTLLAALLVAGWNTVFRNWLGSRASADDLVANQAAVIDYAVTSLPPPGRRLRGSP